MNISALRPALGPSESFRRARHRFIPKLAGCYALTTFTGEIIYLGLTRNLWRRFVEHLDTPEKTRPTPIGKATTFWWLVTDECESTERAWLNLYESHEGKLPPLNRAASPLSGV